MSTAGARGAGDSASAARKRVPSAELSSSGSAAAPPAIGASARSGGRSGGTASKSKHMRRWIAAQGASTRTGSPASQAAMSSTASPWKTA